MAVVRRPAPGARLGEGDQPVHGGIQARAPPGAFASATSPVSTAVSTSSVTRSRSALARPS